MRKVLVSLLVLSIIAMFFASCERKCVCKYNDDGTEVLASGAYTKKECRDYESELNALGMDITCTYK